jgi:hypothetical protein
MPSTRWIRPAMARTCAVLLLGAATGCLSGTEETGIGSYSFSVDPTSLTIPQGGSATTVAQVMRHDYGGEVNLSLGSQANGITIRPLFVPLGVTQGTLQVDVAPTAPLGKQTLTIDGIGGDPAPASQRLDVTVVAPPSLAIALGSSSIQVTQGRTVSVPVTVARNNSTALVTLSVISPTPNVTAVFDKPTLQSTETTSNLSITAAPSAMPATLSLDVSAGASDVAENASASLSTTVNSAYQLVLTPGTGSIGQGVGTTSLLTATHGEGDTDPIGLSIDQSTVPDHMTVTLNPNTLTGPQSASDVSVTTTPDILPGAYAIHVIGTRSPFDDRGATFTVTVGLTGAYALSLTPSTVSLHPGGTTTAALNIGRTGGFHGTVAIAGGSGAGIVATVNPASTTSSTAVVTVVADANANVGMQTLHITGSAPGRADQVVDLGVDVTPAPPVNNNTWTFCAPTIPIWFSYLDGATWHQVVGVNDVYDFNIASDRGGVAFVTQAGPDDFSLQTYYDLTSKLTGIGATQCPATLKTLTGTISGASVTDFSYIALGSAQTSRTGNGGYSLHNVPFGQLDLLLGLSANAAQMTTLTKFHFERMVHYTDGSSVPIDWGNAANTFAPENHTATINGLNGRIGFTNLQYRTPRNAFDGLLYQDAYGSTSNVRTIGMVPLAQQEAGDLHIVSAFVRDQNPIPNNSQEVFGRYMFGNARDVTFGVPSGNGCPNITPTQTNPYLILNAPFTTAANLNKRYGLSFTQSNGPYHRSVSIEASFDYFNTSVGSQIQLSNPVFPTNIGFNNLWMPIGNFFTPVDFFAYGSSLAADEVPVDGGASWTLTCHRLY